MHLLLVGTERRRGKADDLRIGESAKDLLPALGRCVVSLVDEDHVEEVWRELGEPPVCTTGELLDVGHDEVALDRVVNVSPGAVENGGPGAGREVG